MNLKKTAIALAVASVAATPLVAAADGTIYGSMRYGFENTGDGFVRDANGNITGNNTEAVNQFKNFGSRFGFKGDTDLGNGLTAFGHWHSIESMHVKWTLCAADCRNKHGEKQMKHSLEKLHG